MQSIMCDRVLDGRPLPDNLVFLAAANPYRVRRGDTRVHTSGLDHGHGTEEASRLVYRVLPLPDTMWDCVINYAALTDNEERAYIEKMVAESFKMESAAAAWTNTATKAIVAVHHYVKSNDKSSPVSLRDVSRVLKLFKFFQRSLRDRPVWNRLTNGVMRRKYRATGIQLKKQALCLAMSHCYVLRLANKAKRAKVFDILSQELRLYRATRDFLSTPERWLQEEQKEYIDRMIVEPEIAKNGTLMENVFAVLVGVLNRIPIFATGIPGCSKTLAMRLVSSNLRGRDSKDAFFRSLPKARCITFQGSRQSTSASVEAAFDKAIKNQQKSRENGKFDEFLYIVVMDEVCVCLDVSA